MPNYAYGIAEQGTGITHIGHTGRNHPLTRIREWQRNHALPHAIVFVLEGGSPYEIESRLHRQFTATGQRIRAKAEFFALTMADIESICGMPEALSSETLFEIGIILEDLPCETGVTAMALALKEKEQEHTQAMRLARLRHETAMEAERIKGEEKLYLLKRDTTCLVHSLADSPQSALSDLERGRLKKELRKRKDDAKIETVKELYARSLESRDKYQDALGMVQALLQTECTKEYGEDQGRWDNEERVVKALRLIGDVLAKQ